MMTANETIMPGRRVALVLRCMGAALLAIGLAGYLLPEGPVHWTALIPAILGGIALLLPLVARQPVAAAVAGAVLCAVALMGGGSALPHLPALMAGEASAAIASRAATAMVAILALAGLGFAILRRGREAV